MAAVLVCSAKLFHLEPSRFSTVHARYAPAVLGMCPKVVGFKSNKSSLRQPDTSLASIAAKLSTTGEQSFTPNTAVASNTSSDWLGARCTSNAITFLPATAPAVDRITWNLEKAEASCVVSASELASNPSSRLKRATM